ncbi:putative glutamine amidotransferase-like protein C13C5.04 [Glarea lozoyensis 74030]|uniref:Putative glutamine amidotransferase-like protein C13C5.04 n=1 Tax=Glarea lozoyensis (strain ATCC 74030 / MF5533) TaxID=1104152 RepID=H0ESU9_GLAL7|nr:putative glutamine amidotransferase-like protein C13C5.04 [Glarea lozoyensis 74030]
MPSLPLRIAILETDTPVESIRAKYGGYGSIFKALLQAGADNLKHEGLSSTSGLEISSFDVVAAHEYPKLEDVDGILITGSNDKGWETSVTAIDLTKRGQEIFGRASLALHQMHRDIVYEYPPEVEQLGYTDRCAVQGMYIEKRIITVQGHPEFTGEIMRTLMKLRHEMGLFNKAEYEESIERADKYQDGVIVAEAFLKFLLND